MTDTPVKQRPPTGLGTGGRALWRDIADVHELDPAQRAQLHEACRAKDRLDKLDGLLRGDVDSWATLVHDLRTEDYELRIDGALGAANTTANMMKQLLAALRLPDTAGKRPQQRGGARGAYAATPASATPGKVSSLDRARAAKVGS